MITVLFDAQVNRADGPEECDASDASDAPVAREE
jgi:hypothetical protein